MIIGRPLISLAILQTENPSRWGIIISRIIRSTGSFFRTISASIPSSAVKQVCPPRCIYSAIISCIFFSSSTTRTLAMGSTLFRFSKILAVFQRRCKRNFYPILAIPIRQCYNNCAKSWQKCLHCGQEKRCGMSPYAIFSFLKLPPSPSHFTPYVQQPNGFFRQSQ